jgi:drug/metabolite transporter (DMT)-like permease
LLLACGLVAVLLTWGVNYLAAIAALAHLDLLSVVAFRFEVAGAIMLAIYWGKKPRVRLQRRHIGVFVCLAFFGVIVNQGLFTAGLDYTIPSHSAIIGAIDPILILLLARAMRIESFSAGKLIGMGLAFTGIVVLEIQQGQPVHSPLVVGDLITFGGAIGFSIYAVLAKRVTDEYDTISLNTFNCAGAAIVCLPLAVRQAIRLDWSAVAWQGWAGMLYMAIFSSVMAYLIFYWTLRHMDPSRVAAINYVQPIVVILLASVFLAQHPSRHLLIGTVFVLSGVYLAERGARVV